MNQCSVSNCNPGAVEVNGGEPRRRDSERIRQSTSSHSPTIQLLCSQSTVELFGLLLSTSICLLKSSRGSDSPPLLRFLPSPQQFTRLSLKQDVHFKQDLRRYHHWCRLIRSSSSTYNPTTRSSLNSHPRSTFPSRRTSANSQWGPKWCRCRLFNVTWLLPRQPRQETLERIRNGSFLSLSLSVRRIPRLLGRGKESRTFTFHLPERKV